MIWYRIFAAYVLAPDAATANQSPPFQLEPRLSGLVGS